MLYKSYIVSILARNNKCKYNKFLLIFLLMINNFIIDTMFLLYQVYSFIFFLLPLLLKYCCLYFYLHM